MNEYLNTLDFPVGEVSRFKNAVVRSSTPLTSIINLSVVNRQHIDGLVIFKDDEMPPGLPIDQRRFVNMPILEAAFNNGEFKKIFGIKTKRLPMAGALIKHWREITGQPLVQEQPTNLK